MKAALFLLAAAAAPASIPLAHAAPKHHELITRTIVYGNDPCPRGGEEIVVCARKPESERYRIPKALRDQPNTSMSRQSWANRAVDLEYSGASGIGSCSPVGSGGASGCYNKLVRQAREERRQTARDAARVP